METAQFRLREMVSGAWRVFTDHFMLLFFGHLLINLILGTGPGIIIVGPLWYGLCAVALLASRGVPATLDDLFSGFRRFAATMVLGLLLTAMAVGGWLLFVMPTLALGFAALSAQSAVMFVASMSIGLTLSLLPVCAVLFLYSPAFFILADGETDALQAMRASRMMVWNNRGQWLGLWVVLSLLHLAGLLMCCVGIYLVTPWMVVVLAMAYDREKQAGARQ